MEYPQTEQDIYLDWSGRRTALLKALTDDVEDLYRQCNPEKENLCLYGGRDGNWSVAGPAEEVPPELPEPCLGINFARDGMQKRDWLTLVAVHSDSWLLAVAFFYGVKLDSASRLRLFKQLNSQPTLFELVNERNKGRTPTMPQHLMMQGGEARKRKAETLPIEMSRPTEAPESSGRLLTAEDISPALTGRAAELYWPDNHLWYAVRIESVDLTTRAAKITYATGEEEDLELEEILKDGHMALL